MKTVLYFGIYDRRYSRTRILRHGFERNGWQVDECHVDPRMNKGVLKYLKLFISGMRARRRHYDLVIVGFPGHTVVWLARLIFGRDIIFDAFLSLYEANLDRRLYTENSLRARKDKWLDTWSCRLAGKVLVDTNALKENFARQFGVSLEKCIVVPVGADDTIFFPHDVPDESSFTVHFHGTFIPLQGVSYIVDAADMLRNEDIRFRIVGSGQEAATVDAKIKQLGLEDVIERVPKVPVEQIPGYMARAQVVLGIFGDVERGKRAIPNKVYEAMAMGKAIITEDGPGMRELPNAAETFILVPPEDSKAMAEAIRNLKKDDERRLSLGRASRDLFESQLLPEKIVEGLLAALR